MFVPLIWINNVSRCHTCLIHGGRWCKEITVWHNMRLILYCVRLIQLLLPNEINHY